MVEQDCKGVEYDGLLNLYACERASARMCASMHKDTNLCVCVRAGTCACVCACVCICGSMGVHADACISARVHVPACVCVCARQRVCFT